MTYPRDNIGLFCVGRRFDIKYYTYVMENDYL